MAFLGFEGDYVDSEVSTELGSLVAELQGAQWPSRGSSSPTTPALLMNVLSLSIATTRRPYELLEVGPWEGRCLICALS
eukprot:7940329-Pyramimonas_sp.AAC.2